MNKRTESKTAALRGETYTCTVEHQLNAGGQVHVSYLAEARDSSGRPVDEATRDELARILGVV